MRLGTALVILGGLATVAADVHLQAALAEDECEPASHDGQRQCALQALQRRASSVRAASANELEDWLESGQPPVQGICAVLPQLPMCWGMRPPTPPAMPPTPPWWPVPPAPAPPPASLSQPSNAPLLTFYVYRVQSDENWPLTNKNAGNIAGMMWYLHNEVVWHKGGRYGTYFRHPVTRLVKFKVQMRATQPLYDLGMNFGVVNTMDSNRCTGPFNCDNLPAYGGTVGCETWEGGNPNNFPHQQWNELNRYPGATWYSLPEAGHCPGDIEPTGEGSCVYSYKYMGEITIDQLEGLSSFESFARAGGREYAPKLDNGIHMSFWKGIKDARLCQWRVDQASRLFKEKYPWMEDLPEPPCDFNKLKFYHDRRT